MNLDIQRLEDTCTVTLLEQRLDALSSATFRQRLMECVDGGCQRLVLDLSCTTFVDSSGLGVLVATLRRLPGRGSLVLRGVTPPVERTLRLARLDRILVVEAPSGSAPQPRDA
jgi:anti-sigma B factor antagonist